MKKRLIVILLCVSCIPLLFASLVSYKMFETKLIADYSETSLAKAQAVQQDVRNLMDRNLDAVRLLAQYPAVVSLDAVAIKPILMRAAKLYPDINFIIDDLSGQQLVRDDNTQLINIGDRPYFKKAVAGQDNISEVVISRTTNLPTTIVAVPIRDDAGTIRGVAQGPLILNKLDGFVKERSVNGSTVFILDHTGKIIAHPESNLKAEERDLSKLAYVQQGLGGQNGTVEATGRSGQKVLINYVYDKATGWLTCTETPYDIVLAQSRRIMYQMFGLLAVTMLLVGAAGFFLAGRIVNPIVVLVNRFKEVAGGNLAVAEVEVASRDEIGQLGAAFNAMLTNLRSIVRQVAHSAEQVAASSEELTASASESAQSTNQVAATITEIATGTEKQASSAANIAAVAGQISANTQQISRTAEDVSKIARSTSAEADQGRQAVGQLVDQMKKIGEGSQAVQASIAELAKGSHEISEIISLISTIAGQTNLLALNAAIEAARAGEAGWGFAVVAEEVRKLAEESNKAAQQIGALIQKNQTNMDHAVSATQAGTEGVGAGVAVVDAAGNTFNKIIEAIITLSEQVKGISESINQVASGSNTLVASIREIDAVSKHNASEAQTASAATEEQSASMQEIASSSQSLARLAGDLQAAVAKFRV
ncbi:MAG: methyl-accepting chemotaxis protein [Negativicutes bacterium]|nr:methyl-accepting chemotaxis protein [Negativicutes bacterium]